jgi:Domain of unknown function (DUF4919)
MSFHTRLAGIVFLSIVQVVLWCFTCAAAGAEKKPVDDYTVLLARAKLEPMSADFSKLRMAFTKSPAYRPYETYAAEDKEIEAAIAAADWKRAGDLLVALLEKNYLRLKSHVYAITIYDKIDNPERGLYHRAFFDKLLDAVVGTRDGRTTATAFVVINIEEERDVIRLSGFKLESQKVHREGGKLFDVTKVTRGGETVELYFDVTLPSKYSVSSPVKK